MRGNWLRQRRAVCGACATVAVATVAVATVAGAAAAQRTRPDSVQTDSARLLQGVTVTVSRSEQKMARAPWAIGVQRAEDIRRAQPMLGVDEALNNVPGVMVSNRYIYALDQRLSIRGAGSRANFGTRGVKILLDGVPQSLPDGQSQLTNVELATIGRIEILRGAASSLYGNGSGGVISFETDMRAPNRLRQELRAMGGSFDTDKLQERTIARFANGVAALSLSRTTLDGFRGYHATENGTSVYHSYSSADVRQANGAVDYFLSDRSTLQLRAHGASVPFALNPGALTEAEWRINPDSAAAANIARGASRAVGQHQYSLGWKYALPDGGNLRAVAYGLSRSVDNPLATPPPGPAASRTFANGTISIIKRRVLGARVDAEHPLWTSTAAPRVALGVDLQRSRDHRENWRSTGGRITAPTDTLLVDQIEVVSAFGPFAQVSWSPIAPLLASVGARWDRQQFRVTDHFLADGKDDSGDRVMSAWSGHLGVSYLVAPWFIPYANTATAFDTPTTTELNAREGGSGGFNPDLGPQRSRTVEGGVRGAAWRLTYDASVFRTRVRDAIIQFQETNGRAFFRNAGRTRSTGAEVGLTATVSSIIELRGAYTQSRYLFDTYRIERGATTDTLDGKRLAGIPESFVRAGLRTHARGLTLDADWTWSDWLWGDDRNTVRVEDWGRGRVDVRLGWTGILRGAHVSPFVVVNNAANQRYVGSITLNGDGGRVREGAPMRHWYAGIDIDLAILK
jgi:iron complex outermembrane receptor protein